MTRTERLGILIVGGLLIFCAGIFMIGNRQFLFSSTYRLKADFATVAGLNGGAEVRVAGIHKGTVRQIQLPTQPNQKITVIMDLESSTRDVVKQDSVASIQTEGLLGDKYVEVSFGSPQSPKVSDGDTIQSEPTTDIADLIKKTSAILDSSETTMKNMDEISSKIAHGKGSMGALVNDRKLYQDLSATTAKAKEGATAFDENMEAIKHNFLVRGFYRKRGYNDSAELSKYNVQDLPQGQMLKQFSFDGAQIFGKPDATKLKNGKSLDQAGSFLEQNKFGSAVVVAHAAMTGDTQKDLVQSQARAMLVRDYLVNKFKFDDTRLKTMGRGKTGESDQGAADKVEIIIYPAGVEFPAAKADMRASR
ncbi:MAG TPA: MlaD family protein [Terriglobia bacterium]|nr:MlaD family protein [Terriglobia bacterium]